MTDMLGRRLLLLFIIGSTTAAQLNFGVIGDWGTGKQEQKVVANALAEWSKQHSSQFTISVGDNFYEWGVSSDKDSYFEDKWNKVYNQPSLRHTWYIVNGNHDHYFGRGIYQVRHSTIDKRWYFPALYYSVHRNVGKKVVQFVFWDSEKGRFDDQMINWLKTTLENSKADWIFVIAHHPIVSTGEHGIDRYMRKKVLPLLEKAKVPVYFTGHDHDLEYLHSPKSVVHHVISGAGGKSREQESTWKDEVKKEGYTSDFYKKYGFVGVEMTEEQVKLNFIDSSGAVLKTVTLSNPRPKQNTGGNVKMEFRRLGNVVSTAPTVRESNERNADMCKEFCMYYSSFCHGFSYKQSTGQCYLKSIAIKEKGRTLYSPGTDTYIRS